MKLDGVELFLGVLDGGDGIVRAAGDFKAGGNFDDVVTVGIPDIQRGGDAGEKFRAGREVERGAAVFAAFGGGNFSAERVRHPLHAVANAEHRDAEVEHGRVAVRSVFIVDRANGAAGKDDADGLERADFVELRGAREHGGENLLFADAAGDELRVLAAEVEDDDAVLGSPKCWRTTDFALFLRFLSCDAAPLDHVKELLPDESQARYTINCY